MPMIFELFGPPGSGKSTLCKHLKTGDKVKRYVNFVDSEKLYYRLSKKEKIKAIAWFVLNNNRFVFFIPNLIVKSGNKFALLPRIYRIILLTYVNSKVLDKQGDTFVDQGVIQAFWSLFVHAEIYDKNYIYRALNKISLRSYLSALVFLDCDPDTFALRVKLREEGGGNRTKLIICSHDGVALEKSLDVHHYIIDYVVNKNISLLRICGKDRLVDNEFKVAEWLESFYEKNT